MEYTYDAYGKLSKIARGGTEYSMTYTVWNLPQKTKVGSTALSTNAYDSQHRLSTVTYANGFRVRYAYDTLNRVKEIYHRDSTNAEEELTYAFFYNGSGELYEIRNYRTLRASFFEYDQAGRCMASTERAFTVSSSDVVTYGDTLSGYAYRYDDDNRLTKLTCTAAGVKWSTEYTYTANSRPKKTILANDVEITNTYDKLGRPIRREIGLSQTVTTTITYTDGAEEDETTALVKTYKNGSDPAYTYTYDDNGNISKITQGSTSISYTYDAANRLTRENNQVTNETVTYEYDTWGNILNKKIYAYTTNTNPGTPTSTVPYVYGSSTWGDQLTNYNGTTITYDSMGNPLTYRNGYAFTWRGKQLTSADNGTNSLTFEYNEDGLRQRKTCNSTVTDYYYNGSVLIGMQRGAYKYLFSYDAKGNVVSVRYAGTYYYYLRNAQGDIVKLIDGDGNTVVEYTYNSWGKQVSRTGSMADTLGKYQPFRYRGYVYDYETGYYYLQSRYYDPTTGRFISADVLLSTGQGVLGNNAYAYCLDNPVMLFDDMGTISKDTIDAGSDHDSFDRLEDLLQKIGNKLNHLTSLDNNEYGCYLYQMDGMYYYSQIVKGSHNHIYIGDNLLPKGVDTIGTIHSHPYCTLHNCVDFSDDDYDIADEKKITIYLASPIGCLYYYTPPIPNTKKHNHVPHKVDNISLIKDGTIFNCARGWGGKHIKPFISQYLH